MSNNEIRDNKLNHNKTYYQKKRNERIAYGKKYYQKKRKERIEYGKRYYRRKKEEGNSQNLTVTIPKNTYSKNKISFWKWIFQRMYLCSPYLLLGVVGMKSLHFTYTSLQKCI